MYGESLSVTEGKGFNCILMFKEKTSQILRSFFKSSHVNEDKETQRRSTIHLAARLGESPWLSGRIGAF